MAINWDNVDDKTKDYLAERPDLAPTLVEVAKKLQAKWAAEKSDKLD